MCGIYGYIGPGNATNFVFDGLKLLQYRGYDSCGIAYYDSEFKLCKAVGALENLKDFQPSDIAFGHTRWATNGEVSLANTHPHVSFDGKITLVHNGIINNANEIKAELTKRHIKFYSKTDSEVIANYLSLYNDVEEGLKSLFSKLTGSFALIIGLNNGCIYLVKQFCPLNFVIAENGNGVYISSDVASLPSGKLNRLNDGDIVKIYNGKIENLTTNKLMFTDYKNDIKALDKGNFKHYMLKEIFETPTAIKNTYHYLKKQNFKKIFKGITKLSLIGCGTAYNSCLIGQHLLKDKFNIDCCLASNYEINSRIKTNHLHIIVSQSGETADCIKVAEQIKKYSGKLLLITNVENSTLTRFANYTIYTKAGTELAVASTKTYCAQLFTFAFISKILKDKNYNLDIDNLVKQIKNYIGKINVEKEVNILKDKDKLLLIGKGENYDLLLEASLKIREIDYIYTIPMYAGELKHGTLSLIDENSVILAINNFGALNTAINEIESRKGKVLDFFHYISNLTVENEFMPIFKIIPFQLLSYYLAIEKGINPDMPKNLSKSVTVE